MPIFRKTAYKGKVRHLFGFFCTNVPKDNQIPNAENFLSLELSQLINKEEMTELVYHHLGNLNEIMGSTVFMKDRRERNILTDIMKIQSVKF